MWPYPRIVAHRGAGIFAPENTLAAMRHASTLGYRGVEFDVMLARDEVPVLMHDPAFGRTIAGTGNVADYTAAQLEALDAGSWMGPAFVGEPVPTFEAVAQFCRRHGIWMNVEIKPVPGFEHRTGEVVALEAQRLFASAADAVADGAVAPLLSSFSIAALLSARSAAPQVPRAYLVDSLPDDWQATCAAVAAFSVHFNHTHLTREIVDRIRQAGYGVFCYTVNDAARARMLLDWGVDGFCTDRLDLIGPGF
jgi:glycerophosphoryl diester phosphodiesterase